MYFNDFTLYFSFCICTVDRSCKIDATTAVILLIFSVKTAKVRKLIFSRWLHSKNLDPAANCKPYTCSPSVPDYVICRNERAKNKQLPKWEKSHVEN